MVLKEVTEDKGGRAPHGKCSWKSVKTPKN